MKWTEADIPDMSGKTVLITGANTGVGFEAARLFAEHNADIILVCRTPSRMQAAAAAIEKDNPSVTLTQLQCDLSDLDSVRDCADRFRALRIDKIDVLVLNAGAALVEYQTSKQGLEMMFASNFLGHWLLTGLLLDYIKDVPGSRIIPVSSLAHTYTNDLNYDVARGQAQPKFNCFKVYFETKLAMHWLANQLNDRLSAGGAKTVAVAAAPGVTKTELTRNVENTNWMARMMVLVGVPFQHAVRNGAYPYLYAATDPDIKVGNYYQPGNWFGFNGPPVSNAPVSAAGHDEEKAKELWAASEELTSFRYAF